MFRGQRHSVEARKKMGAAAIGVNVKDITGQKFRRLTAQWPVGIQNGVIWLCLCDCGNLHLARTRALNSGNTKSCGCLLKGPASHGWKHGASKSPEYRIYIGAKQRCSRDENYIGRVRFKFKSFVDFFKAVGPRPTAKHTLERIRNNGHYELGNVKWATYSEQNKNRRKSKLLQNFSTSELIAELKRRQAWKK